MVPKYFSDLPKQELDRLFSKCHPLRFDLCSFIVYYNKFGKNPKLYGTIEACEQRGLRGDILDEAKSTSVGPSFSLFSRDRNDSISLPANKDFVHLHDLFFHSIPIHMAVRLIVELYVIVDEIDIDYKNFDDRYDEVVEVDDDDDDDGVEDDVDDGAEEDVDDVEDVFVNKYVFQVCNKELKVNFLDYLSKRPNCPSYSYSYGHGGSIKMSCVAVRYAVDASLEVEFVVPTSKETNIVGSIVASFGKGFDYTGDPVVKSNCTVILLDTKTTNDVDVSVKPGKLNLLRYVLAVPANFSLVIDVNLRDLASGEEILKKPYEFLVPCDGSSSVGSIQGIDCLLNLKVDWKLPSDMLDLS